MVWFESEDLPMFEFLVSFSGTLLKSSGNFVGHSWGKYKTRCGSLRKQVTGASPWECAIPAHFLSYRPFPVFCDLNSHRHILVS